MPTVFSVRIALGLPDVEPAHDVAVLVEDVAQAGVGDHADLRPGAAVAAAVHRGRPDHGRAGDPLADDREQLGQQPGDRKRPARDVRLAVVVHRAARLAGGLQREQPAVVALQPGGVGDRPELREGEVARVGVLRVLLVGPDDYLRLVVAGDVAHGGRVDDRALVELGSDSVLELHGVRVGVDRGDLGTVDHEHGEARHRRRVVAVPRVDVTIHRRRHDLRASVAVQVGHDRRPDEPVLGSVDLALAHVHERLERLAGVRRVGLPRPAARPVGVPRVDLALEVRGQDLRHPVAVEVRGGRRGEERPAGRSVDRTGGERPPARVQGKRVARGGPPWQLGAVGPPRMHEAVGAREDELVAVVAVEVDEQWRGLGVAGQALGEPGQQVGVAMQVEVAAVLARHGRSRPRPSRPPSR